jgi:protein-S-isoprenylcysteine O-methyltransferase Ste14
LASTDTGTQEVRPRLSRLIPRMLFGVVLYGAVLFVAAGTAEWPVAWVFLAISACVLGTYLTIVARLHPDLIGERRKPPKDAKRWDKPLVALIGGAGPVAMIVVCGLDRRFGWTPHMPLVFNAAGLLLVAAGGALTNLAVAANRFFSALIRIQRDRGHVVVDSGPYGVIRHPGYAASIVHMFGVGLALGSVYGMGVAAAVTLVVVVRTALEDRTLCAELDGYADYTRRVRSRLVPGLW